MFFWLADLPSLFGVPIPGLNVFRYITTRTGGAMATAALFVFLFGPWIIDHLRLRQGKGQPIREDGPQSHLIAKTRHADHGRADDPLRPGGLDAAVGQPAQSVCLDRACRDARLRLRRLLRRLSEGHQADACRLFGPNAPCDRGDHCGRSVLGDHLDRPSAAVDLACRAVLQGLPPELRLVLRRSSPRSSSSAPATR